MRDWLRDLRKDYGLTCKQMGKALGITEAYYFYIESGKKKKRMDVTLLARISKALGQNVNDLLALEMAYEGVA